MFLHPQLKGSGPSSCQSLDRVLDHLHPAIANCLERLPNRRSHRRWRADADEPLNGSLGEYINALDEFVASPRQNLNLFSQGDQFTAGDFDVVIRAGVLEDSGLLVKPLMRIRLGAYASPGYLKDRKMPGAPADLVELSCITTSCDTAGEVGEFTAWRLRRGLELKEIRVDARVS